MIRVEVGMKLRVVLEFDKQTRSWSAYCPELPGCASAGDSKEEALKNIREAIALYLDPTPIKKKSGSEVVEVHVR